ncbi:MAG TPA: tetratricopeptide repeat protein, partial [Casimicrobiaceae bacterium]|nr:tetratricopeptide repeat protein [Casimicrobiaceae bacterium]
MTSESLLREGIRLHQAGQLTEAEIHYRRLLEVEPQNPDALHYLGLLAYQAGDYDRALLLIDESLRWKGDSAQAYVNRGNVLFALRRLSDAQAALERALALDSTNADAWFNLGNVQRERQRLADAGRSYRRALAHDPQNARALNNLANLLYLEKRT